MRYPTNYLVVVVDDDHLRRFVNLWFHSISAVHVYKLLQGILSPPEDWFFVEDQVLQRLASFQGFDDFKFRSVRLVHVANQFPLRVIGQDLVDGLRKLRVPRGLDERISVMFLIVRDLVNVCSHIGEVHSVESRGVGSAGERV